MNELEKIMVYEISENLKKDKINKLFGQGISSKEILIHDYLLKNSNNDFHKKSLIENILEGEYKKTALSSKEDFKFMTPKKKMIVGSYKKNISNDLIRNLNPESKKEMKQLYCFDEVYSRLNKNRKEKIDFLEDISSMVGFSANLYKNQLIAQDIKKEMDNFEKISGGIDFERVCFDDVIALESESGELMKYMREESSDFEVKGLVEEVKEKFSKTNEILYGGVEKRATSEFNKYFNQFKNSNTKNFLSQEDLINLEESEGKLSDIEKILDHFGDSRFDVVQDTKNKISSLLSLHYDFVSQSKSFDRILDDQIKLNEKAKKIELKEDFSLFGFWAKRKVRNYVKKTEENFSELEEFNKNKYFRSYFENKKDDLRESFREIDFHGRWEVKLLMQKKSLSGDYREIGYFDKGRKEKIDEIIESLGNLEKHVKSKNLI